MDSGQNIIDLGIYARQHNARAASPFRYPGGKGFLTPFLAEELRLRFGDEKPNYAEPFCGGAGSAMNLLVSGLVRDLHLNDADHRIYSAWRAMFVETDRFLTCLANVEVSLRTWEASLVKLHTAKTSDYDFDTGFAAFFINRTSRSGVLMGSGPIGGFAQDGVWKIDARFNKDGLSRRIQTLGNFRDRVHLSCTDGLEFCKNLDHKNILPKTFLFIDPPYVGAGGRLYYDGMTETKHEDLASWLQSEQSPHWLLTYDDHPLIRTNYSDFKQHKIMVRYSLGRRRVEPELLYKSCF